MADIFRRATQQCQCSGLPKLRFYEGMLPVAVTQIGANCAGEVGFLSAGVLCSALSYGIGYKCSR